MRQILIAVSILAVALPSRADARKDRRSARQVRRLFKKGKALFARGKYLEAARSFEAAFRLKRHKAIAYNLAISYAMAGRPVEAVRYLREFLKLEPNPPPLPEVLRRARQQVSVVVATAHEPDITIYVNGTPAGQRRVEVVVPPGKVLLELRRGEEVVARKSITALPGKETIYEFSPLPPRAVPRPRARPKPPRPRKVAPPPPRRRAVKRKPWWRGRLHWAYFAGAAALAAAAGLAAIGTGAAAKKAYDDFLEDRSNADLRHRGIVLRDTTNALIGVAGAAALAAGILAVFTKWPHVGKRPPGEHQATSGARTTWQVVPAGLGAVVRVRY